MIRTTSLSVLLVFGTFAAFADAQATGRFRYSRPIEHVAAKDDDLTAFVVDGDIYAATRPGLPDLRVFDDRQAETPYALDTEMENRTERTRQTAVASIVSLKPDGQRLEVRIKLPKDFPAAESLVVETPLMNYERKVEVAGSVDGMEWKVLVPAGILFDYSKYMDVSNREIALPKNGDREFKLTIDDLSDERISPLKELTRKFQGEKESERIERTVLERRPFRIDRITAVHIATEERALRPKTTSYAFGGLVVTEEAAKKRTIVTVTTKRQPLTELAVESANRQFSRSVSVEVPERTGKSEWTRIAETTLSKVSFRGENRENLTIAFPERRAETYRIVIANEDNPPLKIDAVTGRGPVRRVLFLAQPGRTYRVEYGSETAPAPKYETAAVLAKAKDALSPTLAKLGEQVENAAFRETPTTGGILNNPWFLGGAIGVMVVVLGWCLMRAGKKLDSLPKEGPSE